MTRVLMAALLDAVLALPAAYRATAQGRALLLFELRLGTGQRIGNVL
ncbi:hypothetical protein Ga0609869_000466 [Rhodovulum iodosum]|uniref:Uncharacterized protein n=1 Tax=Rhodovulum iodosum TaxID=68291 RepID=A0ABV3XP69_9RHOB|nr:hypothetical protein [Rhodovulum robiginosum]